MLLAIYAFFIVYILGRSAEAEWAMSLAEWMRSLLAGLPRMS